MSAKIKYIYGKPCNSCSRTKRRADNRRCMFCEFWDASRIVEQKDQSKSTRNRALKIIDNIQRDHHHRLSCKRGSHRRRCRQIEAAGSFTKSQISAILKAQNFCCSYCDATENLHLDHAMPLSRGGSNWPWNLQWLCAFHNLSKRDKTDSEYRQEINLGAGPWISLQLWSTALQLPICVLAQSRI